MSAGGNFGIAFRNPWKPDPPCPSGFLPYDLVMGGILRAGSWHPSLLDGLSHPLASPRLLKHCIAKVKPELYFCVQTDDITLWLLIISRSPENCNLKSHLWGGCTARDLFPTGTPDSCYSGPSGAVQGFPGGTSAKVPTCQCRRCKRCRFNPCVGKIP